MGDGDRRNRRKLELPQEMTDHIIKFLRYDTKSLKLCCLVCRSWSIAARPHLFRTLVVEDRNSKAIIAIPALSSPYSSVMPYLKGLELRNVQYILAVQSSRSILASLSSTLTCIHLFKCYFNNFAELVDIIQVFPCLQDLSLDTVDWKLSDEYASHRKNWSPSSLSRLRLKNIQMSPFIHWILNFKEALVISDLEVGPVKEENLPAICKFCFTISKIVKYMRLSICIEGNGTAGSYVPCSLSWGQLNTIESPIAKLYTSAFVISECGTLAIFSALESLRIDGYLDSARSDQSHSAFWTARIMSKINPLHIFKYLTLQLVVSRTGELDQYGHRWDFFDEALSGDIFVNFQYLKFEIVGKVDLEAVTSLLSHHLPRLASRGRLRFFKPS